MQPIKVALSTSLRTLCRCVQHPCEVALRIWPFGSVCGSTVQGDAAVFILFCLLFLRDDATRKRTVVSCSKIRACSDLTMHTDLSIYLDNSTPLRKQNKVQTSSAGCFQFLCFCACNHFNPNK